jgi:hypothetical protein
MSDADKLNDGKQLCDFAEKVLLDAEGEGFTEEQAAMALAIALGALHGGGDANLAKVIEMVREVHAAAEFAENHAQLNPGRA